jgi:hypothetical protein
MNDGIDRTDRHLRAVHRAMGDDLDALLDLDGGLREVLIGVRHLDLGHTLDNILDVDAGLQAIVPASERPTATTAPDTPTSEIAKVHGAVATLVLSLDTSVRLAIRNHPALDALAILFTLTEVRFTARALDRSPADDRGRDLARGRGLARDLARGLDLAIDRARVLDLDLALFGDRDLARDPSRARDLIVFRALAHGLARDLVRARERFRELARTRTRARARDLARDFDSDLDRASTSARTLARVLDSDLDRASARDLDAASARDLDRDLARTRGHNLAGALARALARDLDRDLDRDLALARDLDRDLARALARDLDCVRHDFTTADLRGVDLTDVQLDRLRWSMITQWPSDTWRDQVLQDSTEIEPGIYEIRRGTTNVPTHSP